MLSDFSRVPKEPTQVWLFQANPEHWPLPEKLFSHVEEDWEIHQLWDVLDIGDPAVLWQSGRTTAGIYGVAEIAGPGDKEGAKVFLRNIYALPKPILKTDLKALPIICDMSILKFAGGRNPYKITLPQWRAIYALMAKRAGKK